MLIYLLPEEITVDSGPNGNEHFLNCGIDGSGWQPPHVTVDQRMYHQGIN